jgi:4-amino-4-deoxy-L-arabinose transferase-like glycosyltransferase
MVGVPALLALTAVLAVTSLVGDSITFDETSHLTAGMSYLKTGDFRMAPDHPPLAKIWCALPLLLMHPYWPAADNAYWQEGEIFPLGRQWLFELNDGQRLLVAARCMMVVLLLGTCLATYALARRLFGPTAGLLALALAALSPTLLAHGRLVTTDVPIALMLSLTLLTYARLLERNTWPRLLAAGLALAAASVTKMSWPLIVPALGAMAAVFIFRPASPGLSSRRGRAAIVLGSAVFMLFVTVLGIWTCYGWRSAIVPPLPATADAAAQAQQERAVAELSERWQHALTDPRTGLPRGGIAPGLLRALAASGLLPEAYVLGLGLTVEATQMRGAYLMGQYSNTGWYSYFPIAFALKTPLATIGLVLAGIAALVWRKTGTRDQALLIGVATFAVLYAGLAIGGQFNIGQRHLLPIYPVLFVFGGAAAVWLEHRVGRWLVGGALAWLLAANLWIYPQYLTYFNELSGGPRHGYKWLADSNIDWGQDLVRLGRYARAHPEEPVKLAYFGSGLPSAYVPCTALPSYYSFEPRAELSAGIFAISVTQLLGVYDVYVRDEFWTPEALRQYALLRQRVLEPVLEGEAGADAQRSRLMTQYQELRPRLLINRLRHRPPDERAGYSLFIYHLKVDDIERLTQP